MKTFRKKKLPRNRWRWAVWALASAGALAVSAGVGVWVSVEFDLGRLDYFDNRVFTDRSGRTLRFLPDDRDERHLRVPLTEIPVRLQQAFVAAEDERFYRHAGFDPLAILRAAGSNLREGRIVSGASTLTQQVVRSVYPRPRTFSSKAVEAVRAIKAERCLSKDRILEHYLNRAPMGNNLVGVKLAAQTYFGKSLEDLSLAESALLAALPKAPGTLNPYRPNRDRLLARRNWVLERMKDLGFISEGERMCAAQQTLVVLPKRFPMQASHLIDQLLARKVGELPDDSGRQRPATAARIRTTVDLDLQQVLEGILRSHRDRLKSRGAGQAAAMIVDNRGLEVLALVGSFEYGPVGDGYNNGCVSLRSAGSTLKPFLYGLAMERGYTPASLLEDIERRYRSRQGEYLPRNFDEQEYGPVKIRTALGNSLNLSAVRMIGELGYEAFFDRLKIAGLVADTTADAARYGLGLAIGNLEVSLERLVSAYAMLANGGVYRPLRYLLSEPLAPPRPVLSPQVSWLVTDMLSDPTARVLTFGSAAHLDFPYRVAWKSGTSNGYRDSWIAGYTPEYTVGVWVGNFQGDETYHLSGAEGAGGIFSDVVKELYRHSNPSIFEPPSGLVRQEVCSYSGMAPTSDCSARMKEWFVEGTAPRKPCTFHRPEDPFHGIPSQFADWIEDLREKGIDSPFALAGPGGRVDSIRGGADGLPSPGISVQAIEPGREADRVSEATREQATVIGTPPSLRFRHPDFDQEGVRILYPLDNDRFLLEDPRAESVITLKAEATRAEESITWFVDGMEFRETGPPYRTSWKPERGVHTLSAVGSSGIADLIRVTVE